MTVILGGDFHPDPNKADVVSLGPAILTPSQALGNTLDAASQQLQSHREWLAGLSAREIPPPMTTQASSCHATAAPTLELRQPLNSLTEACIDISNSAFIAGSVAASSAYSQSILSVSSTASLSIASLNGALVSAHASADIALSAASSAVLAAESSASIAILSAQNSASLMIASASSMANDARATATQAAQEAEKAQASVTIVKDAAQASIVASKTEAMNTTKFAFSVAFSILGSSILTIILFYFLMQYRRRRKERKQIELKEKIHLRNATPPSPGSPKQLTRRSESYPLRSNRSTQEIQRYSQYVSQPQAYEQAGEAPYMPSHNHILSVSSKGQPDLSTSNKAGFSLKRSDTTNREIKENSEPTSELHQNFRGSGVLIAGPKQMPSRKTTLQYDPEKPGEPPVFKTWSATFLEDDTVVESTSARDSREPSVRNPRTVPRKSLRGSVIGTAI